MCPLTRVLLLISLQQFVVIRCHVITSCTFLGYFTTYVSVLSEGRWDDPYPKFRQVKIIVLTRPSSIMRSGLRRLMAINSSNSGFI